MQTNVNASPVPQTKKVFTPELLVEIFGNMQVIKTGPDTEFNCLYKLKVKQINGEDLLKLLTVYLECNIDLDIRRSGTGLGIHVMDHKADIQPRVLKVFPLEVA
jgi:hypothetical protein